MWLSLQMDIYSEGRATPLRVDIMTRENDRIGNLASLVRAEAASAELDSFATAAAIDFHLIRGARVQKLPESATVYDSGLEDGSLVACEVSGSGAVAKAFTTDSVLIEVFATVRAVCDLFFVLLVWLFVCLLFSSRQLSVCICMLLHFAHYYACRMESPLSPCVWPKMPLLVY